MRTRSALAIVALVGSHFGTAGIAAQEVLSPPILKPLVAIGGTNSRVKKPSFQLVTTSEKWRRVWARHLGTTVDDAYRAIMDVDFDQCLVVVIFRGERIQVRQLAIESISETASTIVVRFSELGYGVALGEKEKPPKPERPYAFIVLPKTNKELVLEEKIWSKEDAARGVPPRWKERARLKPTQIVSSEP